MDSIPGYTIKRRVGSGGMAEVFLATQESFGRDVAIKVLSPEMANNSDFTKRFLREAKIVAGLSHPHIIPVYEVGQVDQNYFMSMDYLPGGDLDQWIKGGIPEDEILKIIEQIAEALHYAHHKGYMHRDIKPANIMFREDNSAVLTDFGIARMQDASDQLTQAGTIIGTPKYMSPEAIKGREPDGRADIYALGIVFYEMLMKQVPYLAADFTALAVKHIQEPIPTLPKAYSRYQAFLNKFMAKDPEQRFKSGREIVKAVNELRQAGSNSSAQVETTGQQADPPPPALAYGVSEATTVFINTLNDKNEGVTFEEKKTGGLFKKYILSCNFKTGDPHSISVFFGHASSKILEWHNERKDQASMIEFNFLTESYCFDRIDRAIMALYQSGGVYEFLKKIPSKISMVSFDGSADERYSINKKGQKVSAA